MDPQARRGTWELVAQLRTDGVSVVLTTHFLDEANTWPTRLRDRLGAPRRVRSPAELAKSGAEGPDPVPGGQRLRLSSLVEAIPLGPRTGGVAGRYLVVGEVSPQLLASLTACAQRRRPGRAALRSSGAVSKTSSWSSPDGSCAHAATLSTCRRPARHRERGMLPRRPHGARAAAAQRRSRSFDAGSPIAARFFFTSLLYSAGRARIDFVVRASRAVGHERGLHRPGSGTGFERRYAVPTPTRDRPAARDPAARKTLAVLLLESCSRPRVRLGFALGWHPHGDPALARCCSLPWALSPSASGLLVAGTLRAEGHARAAT